jgi:hypothetical protein
METYAVPKISPIVWQKVSQAATALSQAAELTESARKLFADLLESGELSMLIDCSLVEDELSPTTTTVIKRADD